MTESSRHLARELVLQALYSAEMGESSAEDSLVSLADESGLSAKHLGFARELLIMVVEDTDRTVARIDELAHNWKLERIAAIDRLILQMALTELERRPDTPPKVVVNEAIELAKTYSTSQSHQFINGILDNCLEKADESSGLSPESNPGSR